MKNYMDQNQANWDERARIHAASKEYALDRFIADPQYISDAVRFDQRLLGDISGRHGIHLQCHIGTDTISLVRLGAAMMGLDFSSESVTQARMLAERSGTVVNFVESNVYEATNVAPTASFDFV